MKIVYLSSEAAPFVKVGGLGDVAGSLPYELAKFGHEVILIIPFHKSIDISKYNDEVIFIGEISYNKKLLDYTVTELIRDNVRVWLISSDSISEDEQVYGSNDLFKYCNFSLAAIDALQKMGEKVDILHANDWHTALSVQATRILPESIEFFDQTATLLTIHNLPYLGHGNIKTLNRFGFRALKNDLLPEWALELPLPIGIEFADWINTVSEGYAKEIQTEEFGSAIHDFMRSKRDRISGILNGLDTNKWNPEQDDFIIRNYSKQNLMDRMENKKYLQGLLGLDVDDEIVLHSVVSRLDYQKGIDLVVDAVTTLDNLDFQLIILGTGDPRIEEQVIDLKKLYPDNIRVIIRYDEELAHRIYAGADTILIPSRYEPCGLTQMIGMRYGCIPIAAATGGLKDTVIDIDQDLEEATGFLFDDDLKGIIKKANDLFKDKERWIRLQINGMSTDFSWDRSVEKYLSLYSKLNKKRKQ